MRALMNCTRRSLMVDAKTSRSEFDSIRNDWKKELEELESKGIM
jgi:hypothetical protein